MLHTSDLIRDLVDRLQRKTMSLFNKFGHGQHPEVEDHRQDFVDTAQPFRGLETEFKQMQYFAQSGHFIQPVEEILPGLSYVQQMDTTSGAVRQVSVQDTYQRIPLRPLLTKILSTPGTLEAIYIVWQPRTSDVLQDI